jgi:hypothetical protein
MAVTPVAELVLYVLTATRMMLPTVGVPVKEIVFACVSVAVWTGVADKAIARLLS